MNYQQEQSQHGVSYEMSSPGLGAYGYDPQLNGTPAQVPAQPGIGWVAVPAPPPAPVHNIYMPKPQHRMAVAIISVLVLLPITLGLMLSGENMDYDVLIGRLIGLAIVCCTIAGINASFNTFRR